MSRYAVPDPQNARNSKQRHMTCSADSHLNLDQIISQMLMTPIEHQKASYYIPYRYEIATRRGALHYFGTRHFLDSSNHQFEKLCDTVRTLKPSIVVVEHHHELVRGSAPEVRERFIETVQRFSLEESVSLSESGLATKLALEVGAEVECPEPTDRERFLALERKGFSHEQIASYYMARAASMLPLWQDRMNLGELLEFRRKQLAPNWPWEQHLLTVTAVDSYLRRTFNMGLFEAPNEALVSIVAPLKPDTYFDYTVLNSIATSEVTFSDIRIVSRLIQIAAEFDTILVVYGSSHAVRQEKALRELL